MIESVKDYCKLLDGLKAEGAVLDEETTDNSYILTVDGSTFEISNFNNSIEIDVTIKRDYHADDYYNYKLDLDNSTITFSGDSVNEEISTYDDNGDMISDVIDSFMFNYKYLFDLKPKDLKELEVKIGNKTRELKLDGYAYIEREGYWASLEDDDTFTVIYHRYHGEADYDLKDFHAVLNLSNKEQELANYYLLLTNQQ